MLYQNKGHYCVKNNTLLQQLARYKSVWTALKYGKITALI